MKKEELMFISNIFDSIPDSEYESHSLIYDTLDAVSRINNESYFIIDFNKNKLVYRTRNLIFIDEATVKDIQRESPNPYWSLIINEDLDLLLNSRKAYLKLMEDFTQDRKLNHTFIIDYRISLKNRSFMITQKFSPLKLHKNGELWIGLFHVKSSPNNNNNQIFIFGDGFRYKYDFSKGIFILYDEKIALTLMEKAIILRAIKGLTTEQIADDLYRSVNTIKTHKKRLFSKLKVNSMNEALLFISNYDLFWE